VDVRVLFSSGLTGGGAIMGIVLAAFTVKEWDKAYDFSGALGSVGTNATLAIIIFAAVLLVPLYRFATAKPES
jgi:hypothetical protein